MRATAIFFPRPLGRGQKVFIPNFFVFLQIKDMKHIEWGFRSDA